MGDEGQETSGEILLGSALEAGLTAPPEDVEGVVLTVEAALRTDEIARDHVESLALELGPAVRLERLGLGGKSDDERTGLETPDLGHDVGVGKESEAKTLRVLGGFAVRDPLGAVVGDGRDGHKDVRSTGLGKRGLPHLEGGFDADHTHARRGVEGHRSAHEHDLGARLTGGASDGVAHPTGAPIAEVANGVEGFARRTRGDHHPPVGKDPRAWRPVAAEEGTGGGDDRRGFGKTSGSALPAGLLALLGLEHDGSPRAEERDVRPGGGMRPHDPVHRRSEEEGGLGGENEGGREIVGKPVGEAGEEMGARGGDDDDLGPTRKLDVPHRPFGFLVPQVVTDTASGERLERRRADETKRPRGHHNPDLRALGAQTTDDFGRLVGGDPPRDHEQDATAGKPRPPVFFFDRRHATPPHATRVLRGAGLSLYHRRSIGHHGTTPMSRVCQLTGKRPMTGNRVSHANNKKRRRFLPNLHAHRLWSEKEGRFVTLRLSHRALRTVHRKGVDVVLAELRARGAKL